MSGRIRESCRIVSLPGGLAARTIDKIANPLEVLFFNASAPRQ